MSNPAEDSTSRGIIVTGGAAGIGWATVRRFANEGARVAILDRDAATAAARIRDLGERHFALQVDVGDEAALVQAVSTAADRLGRLDVLVNNAATIWSGGGDTLDLEIEKYRRLIAVNVAGAYTAARTAAAVMQAQGSGGAIVNVASLAGVVAVPNRTAYSASKAAVIGLTGTLARDFAPRGIRVNAVLPGFTATEAFRASQLERSVETARIERRIPLGRLAEPDEVAAAIQHLASIDARDTAGALLAVDGGFRSYGGVDDPSAGGTAMPNPPIDPRVILVIGASDALASALATRLCGGRDKLILLSDNSGVPPQYRGARSNGAIALTTDSLDRSSIDVAAKTVLDEFGSIDLLVNASVVPRSASFGATLDVAMTKALVAAQVVVPVMIKQRSGAIMNLCLTSPCPKADDGGRSAAQSAMIMLSRSFACDWAKHGIRANTVVSTDADRSAAGVAAAVDFLGSHDASYVTGATYTAGAIEVTASVA